MGFAGNCAPYRLSPQTDGTPVILENARVKNSLALASVKVPGF